MATIIPRPNEDIDSVLKRFKGANRKEGLFEEWERKRYYIKPSMQKRIDIQKNITRRNKNKDR